MKGRIPGFSYNPKKHLARFSLYVPKTNGKLRRERTVHAESREEAIRLWQWFRAEISGNPPPPAPPEQPHVITFRTFVTEYLEKICARRAKKTLAIYRTIAFTKLIPYFGEKPLDAIHSTYGFTAITSACNIRAISHSDTTCRVERRVSDDPARGASLLEAAGTGIPPAPSNHRGNA